MYSNFIALAITLLSIGFNIDDENVTIPKEKYPYKSEISKICDAEHLLDSTSYAICDSLLEEINKLYKTEVVFVSLPEGYTQYEAFDDYCLELTQEWHMGANGKAMLIGVSKYHRKMRIHNNAMLTEILSDDETKYIVDNYFIAFFKKADYPTGIIQGIMAIEENLSRKAR